MSNIYESPQASGATRSQQDDELVTDALVRHIGRGRGWAKFLSVMSYIFLVLVVLGVIGILFFLAMVPMDEFADEIGNRFGDFPSSFILTIGIVYVVVLIISAFVTFLTAKAYGRYGRASTELMNSHDPDEVVESFSAFTSLMKYIALTFGIFFVLAFVFGIFVAMYAASA